MNEKLNFDELTPEKLGEIQRTIWKAQSAIQAAITETYNQSGKVDPSLLEEVCAEYLDQADQMLEVYV